MRKWISISISNPIKTWWKARKYFKFPKPRIRFFCKRSYSNFGKLIDINIHDVYWKDKWADPRHELSPIIYFCLFRTIGFVITFPIIYINEFGEKEDIDYEYWEYLLSYLYYTHSLELYSWCITNSKIFTEVENFGSDEDGKSDTRRPMRLPIMTHLASLNKRGLKEFKKLYDKTGNTQSSL